MSAVTRQDSTNGHMHCPACTRTLHQPSLLSCLHTVCLECSKGKKCPVCAEDLSENLRNHFLANLVEVEEYQKADERKTCAYCIYEHREEEAQMHCLQCNDHVCKACGDAHRRTKVTRDHILVPLSDITQGQHQDDLRAHQGILCHAHPSETLRFFCLKCEDLICRDCKVTTHEKHACTEMNQMRDKFCQKMEPMIEVVKQKIPKMNSHLGSLQEYKSHVDETEEKLKKAVEEQASLLHQLVDKHKEELLSSLTTAAERERITIEEKSTNTQLSVNMLESANEYVYLLFSKAKAEEILLGRSLVQNRLKRLNVLLPDVLSSKLSMRFSVTSNPEKHVHGLFGKIDIFHTPINVPSPRSPRVDTAASPTVLSNSKMLKLQIPLPSPPTIDIKGMGENVRMINSFECKGRSDKKDIWPTGVTTDQNGNVIIVDRENKVVKVFDRNGRLSTEIGKGQLGCPYDATVLPSQVMAVTDHEHEDVKLFSMPDGELIRTLRGTVKYPRGISHNSAGNLLIIDAHHRVIRILEENGRPLQGIPTTGGTSDSSFSDPHYISINYDDSIIISDWTAPHIKAFNPDGQKLESWVKDDIVLQPHGVCTDTQGCVMVADNQRHRVLVITPDGQTKTLVSKEDGLWHPMALTVSPLGHLVITEALGRCKVFKYK